MMVIVPAFADRNESDDRVVRRFYVPNVDEQKLESF